MFGSLLGVSEGTNGACLKIDNNLVDMINENAQSYYHEFWDISISQYKAWIALITLREAGIGRYAAHSQYGGGYEGDRFNHIDVEYNFPFSTGIGAFQLDRFGSQGDATENWGNLPTIKKLNPEESLLSVLRWHRDRFSDPDDWPGGITLSTFSRYSAWNAVNWGRGKEHEFASTWECITEYSWAESNNTRFDVNFSPPVVTDPFENSVKYVGKVYWYLETWEDYFDTWLITARNWAGDVVTQYYYTFREDTGWEAWVWNDPGHKFIYYYERNFVAGPFPENRIDTGDPSLAGNTAEIPTLDPNKIIHEHSVEKKGDVVFIFDATGSMSWIIEDMQSEAIGIMNDIRAHVPDTRFGVGSFVDYPHSYISYGYSEDYGGGDGYDYAWYMDIDLTDNTNDVSNAINSIVYGWGGDGPQDYSRAVIETLSYDWRTDATKIVVLFGDAPPHSAPSGQTLVCPWNPSEKLFSSSYGGDPGHDEIMFTADDLDYGPVVEQVKNEDIIFICVDCQYSYDPYSDYSQDAHNNFKYLSYKTGGSVFNYYESEEEVANEIINRVVEEEEAFYFVHLTDLHYGKLGARERVQDLIEDITGLDPKPQFVVISGDLLNWGFSSGEDPWLFKTADSQNNSYEILRDDLEVFKDVNIPYYVCPGNHEYYSYRWRSHDDNLDNYHNFFPDDSVPDSFDPDQDDRYSVTVGNIHIISINSGWDAASFDYHASGLTGSPGDISWLENDLDDLDGKFNKKDESNLLKIIFMHHPIINYGAVGGLGHPTWDTMCITGNKPEFIKLCKDYNVDLILGGHTHDSKVYRETMDQSDGDGFAPSEFPLSTLDETLYGITGAAIDGVYRMIKCKSDQMLVYRENTVIPTIKGSIHGCPVELHLYDLEGNHVGVNSTGGIDFEIENATYSIMPLVNDTEEDPKMWNHSIEEISLLYGSTDYRFEFIGTGEGIFNFSLYKQLTDGSSVSLLYKNILVTENTRGVLYITNDSVDYTICMDDDGDGIIDRGIQPDNITSIDAPYSPQKPSGPTEGYIGETYNYLTSSIDPEGDHVYYLFDWGDETNSGWLGPHYSGDIVEALHEWSQPGMYEIRVKAKDSYGHISDWSQSLNLLINPEDDAIPPTTIKTIGFPQYFDGDHIKTWTPITLTASDNPSGAGIKEIHYVINGAETIVPGDTVTFTFQEVCNHTLEFWAVDNMGNEELPHTIQIHHVDDTPPETMVDIIVPYHRLITPFDITVSGMDYGCADGCGIQEIALYYRYSLDNTSWGPWIIYDGNNTLVPYEWSFTAPEGDGYYEFYSLGIDNLGNIEEPPEFCDARCCIQKKYYTLVVTTEGDGTVTTDPDQTSYTPGAVVILTAVPGTGWTLSHWSGGITGPSNPITIYYTNPITVTMNNHKTFTAIFIREETINNISANPSTQSPWEPVTISCDIPSNIQVNKVTAVIFYPYCILKEKIFLTPASTTGTTYNCTQTFIIPGCYSYFIRAEDTDGYTVFSDWNTFKILSP